MAKAKDNAKGPPPKSERERQADRRKKLEKDIGPSVALNMSLRNKKRLDQAVEKLTGSYRPGTSERSLFIAKLVNWFYIDHVMKRSGKIAEYIYEKYCEIWELQVTEEMKDKDIVVLMNKNDYLVPTRNKEGSISLEKREWQEEDVSLYRSAEKVGVLIGKASKIPDN
jgi:hypothetical protein